MGSVEGLGYAGDCRRPRMAASPARVKVVELDPARCDFRVSLNYSGNCSELGYMIRECRLLKQSQGSRVGCKGGNVDFEKHVQGLAAVEIVEECVVCLSSFFGIILGEIDKIGAMW